MRHDDIMSEDMMKMILDDAYEEMKCLANILICWNHINEDVKSKYRMSYPLTLSS